jgi:signal transduction histidine kinase
VPKLVYQATLTDARTFEIGLRTMVIGRAPDCDICIQHNSLSRRHASFEPHSGRVILVDLGSKNGSFVNGVRAERHELKPHDKIKLGDVVLHYEPSVVHSATTEAGSSPSEPGFVPTVVRNVASVSLEKLLGGTARGALRLKEVEAGQRARQKLEIILEVSRLLSGPDGIDLVLGKVLDLAFKVLDIDRAAVLLWDARAGRLEPRVAKTRDGAAVTGRIWSARVVEHVYQQSVAALFGDTSQDPRLDSSRSVHYQSIRTSMCAPLTVGDKTLGVLYVDNLSVANRFSEEDLEFLGAFASQAALALENAALYKRIEQEATARTQMVMEAKLRSLSAMMAGIAHELKNPLNLVTNFAEITEARAAELLEEVAGMRGRLEPAQVEELEEVLGEVQDNAARIGDHGRRMDAILSGMLQHARGTAGAREPAELNRLVADGVRSALAAAKGRDASFEVEVSAAYDPEVGAVEMVAANIGRVIGNLVDNAWHAMRERRRAEGASYAAKLDVRTSAQGDRVEVRVRDNGTGIPPEIVGRIFDPFFTTRPPGEGAGLGLSLSHEIVVEGHQGTLAVESRVGEMTEAVMTLPRKASG